MRGQILCTGLRALKFAKVTGIQRASKRWYGRIKSGYRGPDNRNAVPMDIPHPSYAISGMPPVSSPEAPMYTEDDLNGIRESSQFARYILDFATAQLAPGITTDSLDKLVHDEIVRLGGYPSPLNYMGFPKSICTSVNNVVCHGIPDDRELESTDLINIDVTVFYNGYHGDTSRTVALSGVDEQGQRLLTAAEAALHAGMAVCAPGVPLSAIGHAVEAVVDTYGFTICKSFLGHGIGKNFHTMPDVLPFRNSDHTPMLEGMVFTVEPAVNEGVEWMQILDDQWTAVTSDGMRSAQFEHTIVITSSGYEVLTGNPRPPETPT